MSIPTISPAELARRCHAGTVDLIDVRTPLEFGEVHAVAARNVPLDRLDPAAVIASRRCAEDQPLYVICRSGGRGAKACEAFVKAGIANVMNVEGGTQAWEQAGLPVNRGKKVMSLERQVRIVAGLIVFIGAVLALTVDVAFAGIPAFIGAGLMFAGITDTCTMGMLIAKMPWNQRSNAPTCSTNLSPAP